MSALRVLCSLLIWTFAAAGTAMAIAGVIVHVWSGGGI